MVTIIIVIRSCVGINLIFYLIDRIITHFSLSLAPIQESWTELDFKFKMDVKM